MSIFKACDIRGVVGKELDEDIARRIGRALGEMAWRRDRGVCAPRICLGGDFRRSTPSLKQALRTGLADAGALVVDCGQVPTPVAYLVAKWWNCPHVVIVTASHNPGHYNGVKFMVGGRPAVPALMDELQAEYTASPAMPHRSLIVPPGDMGFEAIPDAMSATTASGPPIGIAATPQPKALVCSDRTAGRLSFPIGAYEHWIGRHAASLVPSSIGGLKVVLDPMGGAFAEIAPRVLTAAGGDVSVLADGAPMDPDFVQRDPNPAVDDNLRSLRECVVARRADIGIAFDGDGDRVAFVDHTGRIVRPEQIAAMLVQQCFPQPLVVYDQKCASLVSRAAEAAGGRAVMQPSGYGFIKSTMIDEHADLGVEVSGHYFFKALDGGDDGLFAALITLHVLARTRTSLADLIAPFGWPAITPDLRIPFDGDAAAEVERIAGGCGGRITRLDGVRAEYEDGWALARPSITEPLITLRFEGRDRSSLPGIAERFLAAAPELLTRVMEKIHE